MICLLRFFGGMSFGMALCCASRNWVSLLGCFVVPVALSQPACTTPVCLGCSGQRLKEFEGMVGLPLSGHVGAA